jgi:hypothetical protein
MRVSVVICTRNRCGLLRDTLEGLRALDVPPGQDWELLGAGVVRIASRRESSSCGARCSAAFRWSICP